MIAQDVQFQPLPDREASKFQTGKKAAFLLKIIKKKSSKNPSKNPSKDLITQDVQFQPLPDREASKFQTGKGK